MQYAITGVLKISQKPKARKELDNYNQYVKWILPYTWRIDVIGYGFADNIGGICYSFVFEGHGTNPPKSASQLLREGDVSIVDDTIFNPDKKARYCQLQKSEEDISAYFSSARYYTKHRQIEERESRYIELMERHFNDHFIAADGYLSLFGIKVGRPNKLILTEDWGEVEECICHGALHANNVLIQPESRALAFIDFQQTGFHYIYRDFVSFESSIRIDWAEPFVLSNLADVLNEEIALAGFNGDCFAEAYITRCSQVRKAALQNFPVTCGSSRRQLFLAGCFAQFCWLATRFGDWSELSKKRLLLGSFAVLATLQSMTTKRA